MTSLGKLKPYFHRELGYFYRHTPNRLLLYPFIFTFFLMECATFWLFYQGPAFILDYFGFISIYTLHKAVVYTLCIWAADALTHRLAPAWGKYANRTVGHQWLIWSLGLTAGFILQRTMVKSLIPLYAPEVIEYFIATRQPRLSPLVMLMVLIPYWIIVVVFTLQVALSRQRVQRLSEEMFVQPENRSAESMPAPGPSSGLPGGMLKTGNGSGPIALADITHISVEDHYCRVNYIMDHGLQSELIRIPLKAILKELPKTHFLQVHRSHVVNTGHIKRILKSGRDHKIVVKRYDLELPISRSRFKELPQDLKAAAMGR